MRWAAWMMASVLVGCGGDDGDGSTPQTDTEAVAGDSTSGTTPATGSSSTGGGDPPATSMPPGTNPADTGDDESSSTSGEASSGGVETTVASDSGAEVGGGSIDVTLTGCDIDFGGTVVVSYNGSLGVASIYDEGATLSGSFQFDLDGPASMMLSTQHRVDTDTVVNMVDVGQGTWSNIDDDALSGGEDSIGGTLDVTVWNPARGQAEIAFDGVSLMNITSGNVCTIDGTIVAEELYP